MAPGVPESELVKTVDRRLFGRAIPLDQPPVRLVVSSRARRSFDQSASVIELYRRAEILSEGVRIVPFGTAYPYPRSRRPLDHVVLEFRRERARIETRSRNRLHERVRLGNRQRNGSEASKARDPGETTVDFEPGHRGSREEEA